MIRLQILAELMTSKSTKHASVASVPGLTAGSFERWVSTAVLLTVGGALLAGWLYRGQIGVALDPDQDFGYYLGIVGASLMLILLGYPLRKRLKPRSSSFGTVRFWFLLHMLLGLLGPTTILFHARFSSSSFNGTVAMAAMLVVASSGIIGRFLYSRVHRGYSDRKLELRALKLELQDLLAELDADGSLQDHARQELEKYEVSAIAAGGAFWSSAGAVIGLSVRSRRAERRLGRQVRAGGSGAARPVDRLVAQYFVGVRRAAEFAFFDRLLRLWHLLHMPLFVILVASAVLHVVAVHMY